MKKVRPTTFHIISLFPDAVQAYLGESILKRAIEDGKIRAFFYNPKEFADRSAMGLYERIDKKPYGGGPGMVIQAEPVLKAAQAAKKKFFKKHGDKPLYVFFSPQGKQFSATDARTIAKKYSDIVLISGRYEGIDARVRKILKPVSYSVGPYVLTGGEVPAMIVVDAVSRQIEGVLGDFNSLEDSREASDEVYTRPEILKIGKKSYRVPKVLLSGNHKKIEEWRKEH
jgi:tRNA (guanine37-N1)-methyltransferase